jgi:hypothetical protein
VLVIAALMAVGAGSLRANHPGVAPCPVADKPAAWQPPGGDVILSILSAEVPSDIDSEVLFFARNRASGRKRSPHPVLTTESTYW